MVLCSALNVSCVLQTKAVRMNAFKKTTQKHLWVISSPKRVRLTDNNGISVADIDFLSRLYLMTFKGQCHYINGRVQRSVAGQHNGTGSEWYRTSSHTRSLVRPVGRVGRPEGWTQWWRLIKLYWNTNFPCTLLPFSANAYFYSSTAQIYFPLSHLSDNLICQIKLPLRFLFLSSENHASLHLVDLKFEYDKPRD